jgi:hypothetical protein
VLRGNDPAEIVPRGDFTATLCRLLLSVLSFLTFFYSTIMVSYLGEDHSLPDLRYSINFLFHDADSDINTFGQLRQVW